MGYTPNISGTSTFLCGTPSALDSGMQMSSVCIPTILFPVVQHSCRPIWSSPTKWRSFKWATMRLCNRMGRLA